MEKRRYTVGAEEAGERIDTFLAKASEGELSRARIQGLIAEGAVTLSGVPIAAAKRRVLEGEEIEIGFPAPEDPEPQAEAIPLVIAYEDDELVVVDKPAGLVTHPGPGNWTGTLVNGLIHHCGDSLSGINGVRRPGIVHRLDKETSGLIVVAKTDAAHKGLAEQFAAHGRDGRMRRAYDALVWGKPLPEVSLVDAPLGRARNDRTRRAVVSPNAPDARHAVTHYTVLSAAPGPEPLASLVECRLETGRTHQIRVHMAHIKHPLVGDVVYGAGFRTKSAKLDEGPRAVVEGFTRQALHAAELGFVHPVSGEAMAFRSPIPADMRELCAALSVEITSE